MKRTLAIACLLFAANTTLAAVIYYPPNYYNNPFYNPYTVTPYNPLYNPYYRRPIIVPRSNDINSCPLQPSYYDANGNWVAPKRVCPH